MRARMLTGCGFVSPTAYSAARAWYLKAPVTGPGYFIRIKMARKRLKQTKKARAARAAYRRRKAGGGRARGRRGRGRGRARGGGFWDVVNTGLTTLDHMSNNLLQGTMMVM